MPEYSASPPPAESAHATDDPPSRLGSASVWTLVSYASTQGLRFVGNIILWRLLFPEAFGIMALVNSLVQALTMFSDVGIGPSIVQNRRGDDPAFLNTAFVVQVGRGLVIWLVCTALAIPMARFYAQPVLAQVVPVVGLTALIQGLLSTRLYTAQRHLSLGPLTVLEVGGQVVGTVTMIAWALVWPSVWALAVGSVVGAIAKVVLSHRFLRGHTNQLRVEPAALRDLARFGRWIFLSTLLNFLALQSDRLIFGRLVDMALLGVYSIAQALATIPALLLGSLVHRAIFPHLSRELHRGRSISRVYREVRLPMAFLAAFLFTALLATGPALVDVLYGERAREAGFLLQILAAGNWFAALRVLSGSPLLALGMPKWLAAANAAKVVAMAALIAPGYAWLGFPGAVIGFALGDVVSYLVVVWATQRHGIRALGQDVALTAAVAGITAGGLGLGVACRAVAAPSVIEAVVVGGAVVGAWAATWRLSRGSFFGAPSVRESAPNTAPQS